MRFAFLIEPPFNYRDDDGNIVGCDVELAETIARELKSERFTPIEAEFADLLPGVANGRWRMTTGLFSTEERRKTALFSRPIWALPDGLLVQKGNPFDLDSYTSIAKSECSIAVIRDQFQHRSAIEFGIPNERITMFETYTEAALAVSQGDVATYASVARAHSGFIDRNLDLKLEVVTVPSAEKKPAYGAFAISKNDQPFLTSVNQILDTYLGTFEHREVMAKYGFSTEEVDLVVNYNPTN